MRVALLNVIYSAWPRHAGRALMSVCVMLFAGYSYAEQMRAAASMSPSHVIDGAVGFPTTIISNPDVAAAYDAFGNSVAVDDETMIVGVMRDDTLWGSGAGSARVYVRQQGVWVFEAQLLPDDGGAGDFFGASVAVDGDTAVVGAPLWEVAGANAFQINSGAVYVFIRNQGVWQQQAKLTRMNGNSGFSNYMGGAVAVAGDFLIAGAVGSGELRGAVFAYERVAGNWIADEGIYPPPMFDAREFGYAVAMQDRMAVVTSLYVQASTNYGKAYVYARDSDSWALRYYLYPVNGTAADGFGKSIAISNHTILVGAYPDASTGLPGAGSVYAYWSHGGEWRQRARFTANDAMSQDRFGSAVAIVGDNAVVGAPAVDGVGIDQGAVYLFSRSNGNWQQEAKLVDPTGGDGDHLGNAVSMSGPDAVIGIADDDVSETGVDAGSVLVHSGFPAIFSDDLEERR